MQISVLICNHSSESQLSASICRSHFCRFIFWTKIVFFLLAQEEFARRVSPRTFSLISILFTITQQDSESENKCHIFTCWLFIFMVNETVLMKRVVLKYRSLGLDISTYTKEIEKIPHNFILHFALFTIYISRQLLIIHLILLARLFTTSIFNHIFQFTPKRRYLSCENVFLGRFLNVSCNQSQNKNSLPFSANKLDFYSTPLVRLSTPLRTAAFPLSELTS